MLLQDGGRPGLEVRNNPDGNFGAVAYANLVAAMLDVTFGRTFTDDQLPGELPIGQSASEQKGHLAFPH